MQISIKIRDELIRTIEEPKNKTGKSHIAIGEYRTKTERYIFAITATKCDLKPKAKIITKQSTIKKESENPNVPHKIL